ncbi:cis-prenyltransferase, partial [Gonapodya sp. JEL0774]
EFIHKNDIRVRVVGNLDLLPDDVRRAAENAMEWTKGNKRANLTICIPYTSRHELASAIEELISDTADANETDLCVLNRDIPLAFEVPSGGLGC